MAPPRAVATRWRNDYWRGWGDGDGERWAAAWEKLDLGGIPNDPLSLRLWVTRISPCISPVELNRGSGANSKVNEGSRSLHEHTRTRLKPPLPPASERRLFGAAGQ